METGYEGVIIFAILVGFVAAVILMQKYAGRSRSGSKPPEAPAQGNKPARSSPE